MIEYSDEELLALRLAASNQTRSEYLDQGRMVMRAEEWEKGEELEYRVRLALRYRQLLAKQMRLRRLREVGEYQGREKAE